MCAPNETPNTSARRPQPVIPEQNAPPRAGINFTVAVSTVSALSLILYLIRMFLKGAQFKEDVSSKGKVALVTSATTPLGMETAMELNKKGAMVYMLCRTMERGQSTRRWLNDQGCDIRRLIVKAVNLENMEEVRAFAKEFSNEVATLDILVNNTDAMIWTDVNAIDREARMGKLGHFLLTELLLPLLKKSKDGRIVVVSSKVLDPDRLDDDRKPEEPSCLRSYRKTKRANVLYARALTMHLREMDPSSTVTVNACYPGSVYENIIGTILPGHSWLRQFIAPFIRMFTKTVKDGVQTSLYLALSRAVEHISGKYFEECGLKRSPRSALDDTLAAKLYMECKKAVHLSS